MQRNTRQRTAILETLARQDDFRSAQQIHEQMKSDGETVGLATVYRTLQALTRTGRLDVLVAGDGEDRKSTRLNSSHVAISYAVYGVKRKKTRSKKQ